MLARLRLLSLTHSEQSRSSQPSDHDLPTAGYPADGNLRGELSSRRAGPDASQNYRTKFYRRIAVLAPPISGNVRPSKVSPKSVRKSLTAILRARSLSNSQNRHFSAGESAPGNPFDDDSFQHVECDGSVSEHGVVKFANVEAVAEFASARRRSSESSSSPIL